MTRSDHDSEIREAAVAYDQTLLGGRIRLTRRPTPHSGWFYQLELT